MIDPALKDKVALVTGGNNPSGIGAAIARALASHGVRVFIHYFRHDLESPDAQHGSITGQVLFVHGGHRMAAG